MCLIETVQEGSCLFNFLEKFGENWQQVLFECLEEFASESVWTWAFGFGETFDYSFNFLDIYGPIQVFQVFLAQSGKIIGIQKFIYSRFSFFVA